MLHKTIISTGTLLWSGILLGIEFLAKPKVGLIAVVVALVFVDLVTGITKAKMKGIARTSEGYRKTIIKLMQYTFAILIFVGGAFYFEKSIPQTDSFHTSDFGKVAGILKNVSSYIMLFIIYIETSSIFENLYEIDNKTPFSKYFIKPILRLLKFGLDNNPIKNASDSLTEEKKEANDGK